MRAEKNSLRRPRRSVRGLSLVEVLVSVGVLGVGVLGVLNLYATSDHATRSSRSDTTATQLAVERLERIAAQGIEALPACPEEVGCRASHSSLRPPRPGAQGMACTQETSEMGLADPEVGGVGRFRVDTSVRPHPDATQQLGARIVTVSVCWTDDSGYVREVSAERMLVPEV